MSADFFKGLQYWQELTGDSAGNSVLVYGGIENQQRSKGQVVGWKDAPKSVEL
jgi:hypothetical protein